MAINASTSEEYLSSLPDDRQADLRAVYELVKKNVPKGYVESMTWGMPTWEIPLSVYPDTYNKKPLMYVALANQKNHMALYLTAPYGRAELRQKLDDGFKAAGKKLDMGGSCLRFKKVDDLPLDIIADIIAAVPVEEYIQIYESARPAKK